MKWYMKVSVRKMCKNTEGSTSINVRIMHYIWHKFARLRLDYNLRLCILTYITILDTE